MEISGQMDAGQQKGQDLVMLSPAHNDVRPFAIGVVVGIGSGLVLGSVVVGMFGSGLSSALHHLVNLIMRSDGDSVDFEKLLQ